MDLRSVPTSLGFHAIITSHVPRPEATMFRRTALAVCLVASTVSAATREEEAKKYAADLKNKDAKVRQTSVKELGKLGQLQRKLTEPFIDTILGALKDSDAKVRGEAARTLGLIDPPDTR